ncbi:hypothetical protein IZY60_13640 [Lutibacter sp. B2]|nr:hypothetical protein [Lutibacter sp. B2]
MKRKNKPRLTLLFFIGLVILIILNPRIIFMGTILLDQIDGSLKTHNTKITTAQGHKFLFKESFDAGFPTSHFYYDIYDNSKEKRILREDISDSQCGGERITKQINYQYYSYNYNNNIIEIYFFCDSFLIYKIKNKNEFSCNFLIDIAENSKKHSYLTPFFRILLESDDYTNIFASGKFLLEVGDKKSYESIKIAIQEINNDYYKEDKEELLNILKGKDLIND